MGNPKSLRVLERLMDEDDLRPVWRENRLRSPPSQQSRAAFPLQPEEQRSRLFRVVAAFSRHGEGRAIRRKRRGHVVEAPSPFNHLARAASTCIGHPDRRRKIVYIFPGEGNLRAIRRENGVRSPAGTTKEVQSHPVWAHDIDAVLATKTPRSDESDLTAVGRPGQSRENPWHQSPPRSAHDDGRSWAFSPGCSHGESPRPERAEARERQAGSLRSRRRIGHRTAGKRQHESDETEPSRVPKHGRILHQPMKAPLLSQQRQQSLQLDLGLRQLRGGVCIGAWPPQSPRQSPPERWLSAPRPSSGRRRGSDRPIPLGSPPARGRRGGPDPLAA